MVYGEYHLYNELVTGANLNQQTKHMGTPHCINEAYSLGKSSINGGCAIAMITRGFFRFYSKLLRKPVKKTG